MNHKFKSSTRPRNFNKIEIFNQTVKKTISDQARGSKEIFFYNQLPPSQKKYFPEILKAEHSQTSVSYKMEYIAAQDLSVVYLQNQLTPKKLTLLLRLLDLYWQQIPQKKVGIQLWKKQTLEVIVDKMDVRWNQYRKSEIYQKVSIGFLKQHHWTLAQFKNHLQKAIISAIHQQNSDTLFATHGDLCFSNIFVLPSNTLKFVDPRGADVSSNLYIPIEYDIAKISQCVYGNYDGILVDKTVPFLHQQHLFKKWIFSKKFNWRLVRLIESSLLQSLLPLHLDRPTMHGKILNAAMSAYRSAL